MNFFDSIKKAVLKKFSKDEDIYINDDIIDSDKLELLAKAVNFSLKNYSDNIDKIASNINVLDYEDEFYNNSVNHTKINKIDKEIKDLKEKVEVLKEKDHNIRENIKAVARDLSFKEEELEKLKKEESALINKINMNEGLDDEELELSQEDLSNVSVQIHDLEKEIINLKVKIDMNNMDIKANQEETLNINHKIEKKKNQKLYFMTLSFSLDECIKFANKIEEKDKFTQYCFQGILDYIHSEEDYSKAIENFDKYFKSEEKNVQNYYICKLYASALTKHERYKEAKAYAGMVLKYKPEDIEIHKILAEIHQGLGENREMETESSIVAMLQK